MAQNDMYVVMFKTRIAPAQPRVTMEGVAFAQENSMFALGHKRDLRSTQGVRG